MNKKCKGECVIRGNSEKEIMETMDKIRKQKKREY